MDEREAAQLAQNRLDELRGQSFDELREFLTPRNEEMTSDSGTWYQMEIQAVWDDKPEGNLRVLVSIDDGGRRAYRPLTVGFIISPTGEFVGTRVTLE